VPEIRFDVTNKLLIYIYGAKLYGSASPNEFNLITSIKKPCVSFEWNVLHELDFFIFCWKFAIYVVRNTWLHWKRIGSNNFYVNFMEGKHNFLHTIFCVVFANDFNRQRTHKAYYSAHHCNTEPQLLFAFYALLLEISGRCIKQSITYPQCCKYLIQLVAFHKSNRTGSKCTLTWCTSMHILL
jgi:hypothetical protein